PASLRPAAPYGPSVGGMSGGSELEIRERLLVLDHWPWYGSLQRFEAIAAEMLTPYPRTLGRDETMALAADLVDRAVPPGGVVLVPLLSTALLMPALHAHAKRHGGLIVPLPMSRHPFVSFPFDPPN